MAKSENEKEPKRNFIEFIRTQGVVGLAVGFVLGGSVSKVVSSLVEDIINPVLSVILGIAGNYAVATLTFGPVVIRYGHFLAALVDFIVIAAVVFYIVHGLGLDKVDKK
jgi:large conductance mechanosensitive channel